MKIGDYVNHKILAGKYLILADKENPKTQHKGAANEIIQLKKQYDFLIVGVEEGFNDFKHVFRDEIEPYKEN